jgi:hypothetical protein
MRPGRLPAKVAYRSGGVGMPRNFCVVGVTIPLTGPLSVTTVFLSGAALATGPDDDRPTPTEKSDLPIVARKPAKAGGAKGETG